MGAAGSWTSCRLVVQMEKMAVEAGVWRQDLVLKVDSQLIDWTCSITALFCLHLL